MKKVWIEIKNKGEIEMGGLHLMGVSSKRGDSEKIGFFGSGNKYSIALLLREKIPFKIFSGTKQVKITTKEVMFRGSSYEQIIIDGEQTSLTTSMGVDWETWFAIRELYCNAIDEGDATLKTTQSPKGISGSTTIFVELTDKLGEFFKDINKYILTSKENVLDSVKTVYGGVHILDSNGKEFIAYRKGIRIFPKNEIQSLYWYNFSDIQINESRVYQYEHEVLERIASYFTKCTNKNTIINYLHNWKKNYEKGAKWEYASDYLSNTWHEVLEGKRVYPENLAIVSGDYEAKQKSFIVPDSLAKKIAEQFKDIEVVGYTKGREYEILEMTESEKIMFDTAKNQLSNIGYFITSKIQLVNPLARDVIAWYDRETDTIFHSRKYLEDIKELKNTLLEEHFHSIGQKDGQRSFVTFLIDEIINRS
jgi:hypothetical protein